MNKIHRLAGKISDLYFYTFLIFLSLTSIPLLYNLTNSHELSKIANISTIIALAFLLISFLKTIIYNNQEKEESLSILTRSLLRYISENENKEFLEELEGKKEIINTKSSLNGTGIKKAEEHLLKLNEKIELLLIRSNRIKTKEKYTPYLDFYQTALLLAKANHSLITTEKESKIKITMYKEIEKEHYSKMTYIKLHIQNENEGSERSVYRLLEKNLSLDSSLIKYKTD
ncbi:hypothetical protein [Vreelandella sp. EE7]